MDLKNYILEAKEQENLPEILDFITNIISQYTDSLSDLSDYSEENFKKWCEDNGIGDMDWDDDTKKNFYKLCDTALSNIKDTDDSVEESFEIPDLNILLEAVPGKNSEDSPRFSKEDAQKLLKQAKDEAWSGIKTYGKKKVTTWSGDQLNNLAGKIMTNIKNKKITSAEEYANAGISAGKAFSKAPGIGKALAGISALSGPQVALITVSVAAVAAGTVVAVRQIKKKKNEKILAGVKAKVEEYKKSGDTEKAKFYDEFYQKLEKTCLDDKGKPRVSPDLDKLPEKDREMFKSLYNRIKKNKNIVKAGKASAPKEQVVKDKDGSEIHARRKKTGIGMTYVRMKDGKEVGYATKDEFQSAKKSNESYMGLSEYIGESIVGRRGSIPQPKKGKPVIGTTCWDFWGDPWTIEVVGSMKNGRVDNNIKKFGASIPGEYGDIISNLEEQITDGVLVGVRNADEETAIYVWGEDGCCYENEDA